MDAKGWEFEYMRDADGGLQLRTQGVDIRAFARDSEECSEALPPIKWPETEEEYREYYERWMKRYDCMVEVGFDMEEPPSFETWYEVMLSGEGSADATSLLRDPEQWSAAVGACPGDPDAFW